MSIQHMQMVFDAGDLTSGEKSVLLAYCNFTDAHGYCWPGVERIADMTGFSDRGVKKLRKALIERGLLATSSRVNAQGVRTTNITRVNLAKLTAMRMPEKTYKDNVVHELEFKDDTTPDQPKGTTGTGSDQPKCTEFPDPGNEVPHKDGEHSAPYPSGGPSGDPSSSSVTAEDKAPVAAPSEKKTKTPETIVIERLGCTQDEATKVVTLINQQGDGHGNRIRSLTWWVGQRDIHTLRQDLAMVRGAEKPAGVSYDKDPGAYLRSINRGGHVPYQNPVDQSVYDEPLLPTPKPRRANGVVGGSRVGVLPNEAYEHITDEYVKANLL